MEEMGGSRGSGPWQGGIPGIHAVLPALLLIALFLLVPPVSATVFMYNGTGGTIQGLINSTTNGDSIFLPAGTYYENLIIDRAIVFGALDTKNPPVIVTTGTGAGIVLSADGITLNGLNIYGDAQTGLLVQSNNNRVTGITVQGLIRGIELKNAANNIISGNTVTNNSVGITVDRTSRSNTFFFNQFANTVDVAGQSANNMWSSTPQDYSYREGSYTGPLGNYWKAYTGTDSDGNGVGDTAYPVLNAAAALSGTTAITDHAPLVGLPGAYTLLVKNTSPMNITGLNGLSGPPALQDGLQPQDQPVFRCIVYWQSSLFRARCCTAAGCIPRHPAPVLVGDPHRSPRIRDCRRLVRTEPEEGAVPRPG